MDAHLFSREGSGIAHVLGALSLLSASSGDTHFSLRPCPWPVGSSLLCQASTGAHLGNLKDRLIELGTITILRNPPGEVTQNSAHWQHRDVAEAKLGELGLCLHLQHLELKASESQVLSQQSGRSLARPNGSVHMGVHSTLRL